MTPELDKYYQDRFSMMSTDGWKDLVDDVKTMIEATNRLDGVDSEKLLWFRKGELSIMNWIVSLRDLTEESYNQIKEEDENAS